MKKTIARKWIAALRSGQYEQTRGQIREGNAFCCLGVLCNLHAQAHPESAALEKEPSSYFRHGKDLAPPVMKWAGLRSPTALIAGSPSLASMNDGGYDFQEIANVIAKNVAAL